MTDSRALARNLALLGAADCLAGLLLSRRRDEAAAAFGRQTAAWGAVDLAIAGAAATRPPAEPQRLRKVLLVNAALDLGYVAAGAHVAYHRTSFGGRLGSQEALGHGLAVAVQGALLLGFDLLHARAVGIAQPSSSVQTP